MDCLDLDHDPDETERVDQIHTGTADLGKLANEVTVGIDEWRCPDLQGPVSWFRWPRAAYIRGWFPSRSTAVGRLSAPRPVAALAKWGTETPR